MQQRNVIHFTDSAAFGGAEQSILTLLEGMDRQRWQPVLVHHPSAGIAPLLDGAQRLGVPCHAVPAMPEGRDGLRHLPGFVRTLRRLHGDVFHAHLTWQRSCKYGLVGAALAQMAVVATVQLLVSLPQTATDRAKQWVFAQGVGRYISVSNNQVSHLQALGIPANKITVIHNAVPFQRLAYEQTPGPLPQPDGPFVLAVARLDRQKGLDVLLDATALLPGVIVGIAGDGEERAALHAQALALNIDNRVRFLGQRHDIPALLAQADVVVLPSRYEGLPLSVLEAMAAGRPVVASAIEGTREAICHSEHGLLVPPDNPRALAGALQMLLSSQALAERLAQAGRKRAYDEFSPQAMVQRVGRVYDTLLER